MFNVGLAESNIIVELRQHFVLEPITIKVHSCNFWKEQKLSNQACNQMRYYEHYLEKYHKGICDWKITIIDHAEKEKYLRQRIALVL